jgi:hypothetical protein
MLRLIGLFRALLLCVPLTFLIPLAATAHAPRQIDKAALPLAGAWDITIHTSHGDRYSWLEIEPSGATLVGRFVGMFGSARPISKIEFSHGMMRFTMPRQYEDREFQFEGKLEGEHLSGTVTGYDSTPSPWAAQRAPALKRDRTPEWGAPIALFDGTSMVAWKPQSSGSNWAVRNHQLVNTKSGANLLSVDSFKDFKAHVEFKCPKGSNSGFFLRGRYEVQIEDDEGPQLNVHSMGAIYGFFPPCVKMSKGPNDWQTFDITLVGRIVTVVFNGEKIIDRQTIPGITGGAIECDEGRPGPILIQGDHGAIMFRKITITPAK